jgi:two-component system, OmpR family, response regulator AdeR
VIGAAGQDVRPDILVVDDDPWIVELVVMAAEERNWAVISAANGVSGLQLLGEKCPRLVLLDVRLPQQNGWDVLAAIERDHPRHPPVIMMTANQLEEEDGQMHGAVAIVRKPFSVIPFLDLLAEHLS